MARRRRNHLNSEHRNHDSHETSSTRVKINAFKSGYDAGAEASASLVFRASLLAPLDLFLLLLAARLARRY